MNKKLLLLPIIIIIFAAFILFNAGIAPLKVSHSITSNSDALKEVIVEVKKNTGILDTQIIIKEGQVDFKLIRPDGSIERKETLNPQSNHDMTHDISYLNGKWIIQLQLKNAILDYVIDFHE